MKKLYIKNFEDFANVFFEKTLEGRSDVCFIGNHADSSVLIKELLRLEGVYPYQISIEPEEWDGYDKEFLVTLDEELNVWCEKAYREGYGYFTFDTDCAFVADDCDLEVFDHIESDEIFEVSYSSDVVNCIDECCEECCFLDCGDNETKKDVHTESTATSKSTSEYHNVSRTKDGRVTGFTKSWTTEQDGVSEYSSFSYMGSDESAVRRLAEDFGIKID